MEKKISRDEFVMDIKRGAVTFASTGPGEGEVHTREEWVDIHGAWLQSLAKAEVDNRRLRKVDATKEEVRARCKAAGRFMKGVTVDLVEGYDKDMARKDAELEEARRKLEEMEELRNSLATAKADLAEAMAELRGRGPAQITGTIAPEYTPPEAA